jgi:hypothetical protein
VKAMRRYIANGEKRDLGLEEEAPGVQYGSSSLLPDPSTPIYRPKRKDQACSELRWTMLLD